VLGIHLVLQQVDLNFFIPRIVGRHVQLHPMVVIIGIIGRALLVGVLGMLLAAPTIASALVLVRYVYCKLLDLPPWPDPGETLSSSAEPLGRGLGEAPIETLSQAAEPDAQG